MKRDIALPTVYRLRAELLWLNGIVPICIKYHALLSWDRDRYERVRLELAKKVCSTNKRADFQNVLKIIDALFEATG